MREATAMAGFTEVGTQQVDGDPLSTYYLACED
ncbi:hypothetical protein ATK86_1890 [Nocardia fluminea]|uniref:Uncharacterized protein n=1 Tax=Nocardia fluminea TaxID=134984 RepID=A0A2N3V7G4_9NOCA|nr:hypothetical protein ATK86_1890 [Nocardia fluminea]